MAKLGLELKNVVTKLKQFGISADYTGRVTFNVSDISDISVVEKINDTPCIRGYLAPMDADADVNIVLRFINKDGTWKNVNKLKGSRSKG